MDADEFRRSLRFINGKLDEIGNRRWRAESDKLSIREELGEISPLTMDGDGKLHHSMLFLLITVAMCVSSSC